MWSQYEKYVSGSSIFELPRVKNRIRRVCTGPFTHVSHYWWKQSFRVFGTGCDRPSARLETTKNVFSYPSRHILSQHPHSHPGYHGVTEVAKTANIPKMAKKCINCISARPTPPHTNPMESGPGNTFSAQNQKNQKIHDFRPKKGGFIFSTFLTPPPPTHLPQNLKKVGFNWGGSRGVWTKNSLGDACIGQNNDFTRG